jgi:RNA polymerase sigma-70 factor (ECF subfamily)
VPPQQPDPLIAYVLRIVRNISLKRVQHNAAAKRAGNYQECYEELSGCIASHDTPESLHNARQLTLYIEDFLSGLSSTNRYLFVRRYWYLDSARDLARATGLTEGTVRTRLSRMRQQLKEMLLEKEVLL